MAEFQKKVRSSKLTGLGLESFSSVSLVNILWYREQIICRTDPKRVDVAYPFAGEQGNGVGAGKIISAAQSHGVAEANRNSESGKRKAKIQS